nr:MFS transporter [Kibdelosporangium sp. MJ126-NF4]CEL13160.1 Tetracycline resistance protein [Kibdelosporangium sp. MJ126-NF4]CTQ98848.1 Tetracycline resistance protein [Kibdelosporangium sp. MJ126-NF4]
MAHPAQRRVLTVLVAAQVLSGAGLAAGITVGGLLAQQMLSATSMAGLPTALYTIGSATAAILVARVSHRQGRRVGLAGGYFTGAVGALGVVIAAVTESAPLLFVALVVYGAGSATNLQARYAGADLAAPRRRAQSVSTVLVATTLGAVLGPNLVTPTGDLATNWSIPRLAGPFLLAAVAYAAAGFVLWLLLRPDPLRTAQAQKPLTNPATGDDAVPGKVSRHVMLGAATMVLSQLVMVAIMTMTPVHMQHHGHDLAATGLVIAIHIGAMYLPSPLTGLLVDRIGRLPMAAASGITLLAAGLLAGLAPADSTALLATALALLGLGWNFGLVSGTAIITDAVPLAVRAKIQGRIDVTIAVAGASGGLTSGFVVATSSYTVLSLAGGTIALAFIPVIAYTIRTHA